jgi:hypothetical protein
MELKRLFLVPPLQRRNVFVHYRHFLGTQRFGRYTEFMK